MFDFPNQQAESINVCNTELDLEDQQSPVDTRQDSAGDDGDINGIGLGSSNSGQATKDVGWLDDGDDREAEVLSTYTKSSNSEAGEVAGEVTYQDPHDTEPLRRFVTRTSSFSKEDFDELMKSPGMYAVKDPHLQVARAGLSMHNMISQGPLQGWSRQQQQDEHRLSRIERLKARKRRQRSALGLPLVRPDNSWYVVWSILVLILDLTYSAFVVPISIGMMTSFFEANWTSVLDYGAGGLFLSDLIINFHVGFIATYNMHKVLVLNPRLIARYYMTKGSFLSDVSSTTAWLAQICLVIVYHSTAGFNPNKAMYVMEGIRLMRFVRVVRLIKRLLSSVIYASISFESKWLRWLRIQSFMYLVYIIYVILVLINFIGCLWNFMAGILKYENTWVNYYPPFVREYSADPSSGSLTPEEAQDNMSDVWLYVAGVYWALTTITTLGYGDIVPSSLLETIVTMGVQIVGVMFFGLLLSTISELLQQVNRNARRVRTFRNKIELVERWMGGMGLTPKLRRRIKTYYAEIWLRQSENREERTLFLELPHALRNEVSWHVNHDIFRHVPMLRDVDDKTLYLIASKMTPYRFGPGIDLCTEGDPADQLWVLVEGEVMALYHFNEAEHVEGPAVLGESVLLQEVDSHFSVHPCTYRTITSCSAWMIEWKDLKMLLAYRPKLQDSMAYHVQKQLAERISQYPHLWAPALKRVSHSIPKMSSLPSLRPLNQDGGKQLARPISAPIPEMQHRRSSSGDGWPPPEVDTHHYTTMPAGEGGRMRDALQVALWEQQQRQLMGEQQLQLQQQQQQQQQQTGGQYQLQQWGANRATQPPSKHANGLGRSNPVPTSVPSDVLRNVTGGSGELDTPLLERQALADAPSQATSCEEPHLNEATLVHTSLPGLEAGSLDAPMSDHQELHYSSMPATEGRQWREALQRELDRPQTLPYHHLHQQPHHQQQEFEKEGEGEVVEGALPSGGVHYDYTATMPASAGGDLREALQREVWHQQGESRSTQLAPRPRIQALASSASLGIVPGINDRYRPASGMSTARGQPVAGAAAALGLVPGINDLPGRNTSPSLDDSVQGVGDLEQTSAAEHDLTTGSDEDTQPHLALGLAAAMAAAAQGGGAGWQLDEADGHYHDNYGKVAATPLSAMQQTQLELSQQHQQGQRHYALHTHSASMPAAVGQEVSDGPVQHLDQQQLPPDARVVCDTTTMQTAAGMRDALEWKLHGSSPLRTPRRLPRSPGEKTTSWPMPSLAAEPLYQQQHHQLHLKSTSHGHLPTVIEGMPLSSHPYEQHYTTMPAAVGRDVRETLLQERLEQLQQGKLGVSRSMPTPAPSAMQQQLRGRIAEGRPLPGRRVGEAVASVRLEQLDNGEGPVLGLVPAPDVSSKALRAPASIVDAEEAVAVAGQHRTLQEQQSGCSESEADSIGELGSAQLAVTAAANGAEVSQAVAATNAELQAEPEEQRPRAAQDAAECSESLLEDLNHDYYDYTVSAAEGKRLREALQRELGQQQQGGD